jgi:hypothetical protein
MLMRLRKSRRTSAEPHLGQRTLLPVASLLAFSVIRCFSTVSGSSSQTTPNDERSYAGPTIPSNGNGDRPALAAVIR